MQVQLDHSSELIRHIVFSLVKRIITFAAANIKEVCPSLLTDAGFHKVDNDFLLNSDLKSGRTTR